MDQIGIKYLYEIARVIQGLDARFDFYFRFDPIAVCSNLELISEKCTCVSSALEFVPFERTKKRWMFSTGHSLGFI